MRLINAAFPDDSDEVVAWPACARLLPHALAVVDYAEKLGVESEATALLLNQAAVHLRSRGQYRQALTLHEQAVIGLQRVLGDDDAHTLTSMNNLALLAAPSATPTAPASSMSRP